MRRTPKWSLLGLIAALAVAIIFGVRQTQIADAHAVLERSNPTQSQVFQFDSPPAKIEAFFSEAIERKLTKLTLYDSTGTVIKTSATTFSDTDPLYASITPLAKLGPGIYTAGFENVSKVDGHAWSGQFAFTVLNQDGSKPAGGSFNPRHTTQGYLPGVGDNTLRWFALLASVTMVGGAAFYVFVARPAADFLSDSEIEAVEDSSMALVADLTVIAVPVLILSVIGQAFLLADRLGGPGQLNDIFLHTRTGELWIARLGVALAILLLLAPALTSERYRKGDRTMLVVAVALLGGAGLLMTYSLNSHAATGGGEFWAVSSDFIHFLATACWLGALIQLPLVFWWTRSKLPEEKRLLYLANVLDRFAWLAVVSVTLLIGTGVFNAFVQLPNKPALWETTYGRVLIAKLALILPLLGVAGLNALYISPRLSDAIDALHEENTDKPATDATRPRFERQLEFLQSALPKTIALELFLGVAVLVSVAVLTQSTTAKGQVREEAGKPHGEFATEAQVGDVDAVLLVKPFGLGSSNFQVTLKPSGTQPLGEVTGVRLRAFYQDLQNPAAGGSGVDQELQPTAQNAVWAADAVLFPRPGNYRLQARVQRKSVDDVTVPFTVSRVGGILADSPRTGLFNLPFTFVDWNIVAGGAMLAFGVGIYLIYRNRPPTWERSTSTSVGVASAVALLSGAMLLFGVHAHGGTKLPTNPFPPSPASIAAGKTTFETNCAVCHGLDGRGNNGRAADLTLHVPFHNESTLFIWISEGIPIDSKNKRMPSWKNTLTPHERWDVINYLESAFGSGAFTPVLPKELQTTTPASSAATPTP